MKRLLLILVTSSLLACTADEQPANNPNELCEAPAGHLGHRFSPALNLGSYGVPPSRIRLDATATFVQRTDGVAEWRDVVGVAELPALRVPEGALTAGASYRVRSLLQLGQMGGLDHLFAVHDADAQLVLLALSGAMPFVEAEMTALGLQAEWVPTCTRQRGVCFQTEAHSDMSWAGTTLAVGVPTVVDHDGQTLTALLEAAVEGEGESFCTDTPYSFVWLTITPGS